MFIKNYCIENPLAIARENRAVRNLRQPFRITAFTTRMGQAFPPCLTKIHILLPMPSKEGRKPSGNNCARGKGICSSENMVKKTDSCKVVNQKTGHDNNKREKQTIVVAVASTSVIRLINQHRKNRGGYK